MRKNIRLAITGMMMAATMLAGCGGSSKSDDNSAYYEQPMMATSEAAYADYEYEDDLYEYEESSYGNSGATDVASDEQLASNSNRKLIRTVNLSVETREFDTLISNVQSKIKQLGGYAESTSISGNSYSSTNSRSAYIVARIPQDKVDSFVTGIEADTNITSKSESAEDVTLSYADIEARKESLRIEQERLFELLEEADSLETIIVLEQRLTEVRYEIESYESRLRTMDNQVTFSTVNLNVSEVKEYKPEPVENPTFGERLSKDFIESCEEAFEVIQDFIIGFIAFIPRLIVIVIILGVIGGIIFGIIKLIIVIVQKSYVRKKAKKPVVASIVDDKPEVKNSKQTVKKFGFKSDNSKSKAEDKNPAEVTDLQDKPLVDNNEENINE